MKTNTLLFAKGVAFLFLLAIFSNIADAQSFKWAKSGVSEGYDYGNAITSDDSGNVYVTGQLEFRCDFGGGVAYTTAGKHDILLGKYGNDGTLKWVKRAGGVGGDVGWGIGVDRVGNIYSAGEFEGTAGWAAGDSLTVWGSNDIYLTKHSNSGQLIWAKKFGYTSDDKARALVVDRDGNIYLTGYFSGTARFGSINVTSSGNNDVFIAKIDSAGDPQWVRKGGGSREDRGRGVALDRQGNVFITGTFTQSANFSGTTLNSLGKNSLFVTKYDNNGNFQWAKGAGTCCDTTRGNAISVDLNGDAYIAGYFKDNTTIGSNSFTAFGSSDIFVAKYNGSNGNVIWSKQAGGPYEDLAFACAFDTVKNQLYVTGQVDDHGNFGSIYVGSAGNRDVVIAAYDANGTELWARPGGGNQRDAGQAITYDTLGNIYTTGFFNDTASFGTTVLQGYPLADFFVAKMAPPLSSQPTTNASAVTASLANCNNIQLNFTAGNGTRRIVIAKAGSTVNVLPVDGNYYTASNTFGAGTDLGSGNFVVYDGTGTSVTISGVTTGTNYYFGVFEYNGVGFGSNYLLPSFGTTNFISTGFSITASVFQNTICNGASTLLHSSPNATSYSWSPANGLSSLTDSVVSAAPTSTTIYTVTASNGSGCTASQTLTITVNQLPTVTLSSPATVCDNSAPVTLTTGSPSGGTYSGTGVSAGAFNPATAGIGTTTLTYSYTNVNNCTASATAPISVIAGPAVTHAALNPICQGASLFTLTGGSPAGGVYSGTGVINGKFNPSVTGPGTHTITYTYTSGGCSASINTSIVVNPTPTVSLATFAPACITSSPITLSGGSPAGGNYSGSQVSSGVFNPQSAGVGTHLITYSYIDGNGCLNSASSNITVNSIPVVTLASISPVCVNASPVTLTGGSPAGGTYSGTGVSGGIFNPSIPGTGKTSITYTYSSASGCQSSASTNVTVSAIPTVTLSALSPVCQTASAVTLSGGSPSGGTYSGTGVTGNSFDPATSGVGTFAITYSYTNANGCSSTAQSTMVVNAVTTASMSTPDAVCDNTSSFALTTGTPSGGTYSGTGVSSNNFVPSVAGVGTTTITYTYTNAQGCASTATASQVVNAAPTVTLGSFTNLCSNAAAITLADGSPTGGTFSGNGVSGTTFTPSVAGAGTTSITYSYTNAQGCTATANSPIEVDAAPSVTLSSITPLCINSPAITLTNGSPAGGTYSGTGVIGNTFTPTNAGTTPLTYSVTAANGCSNSSQTNIVVNSLPVVTLSNFGTVCINGSPVTLSGGQPSGGVYGGTGVSGGEFNPASGLGLHTISYTYTNANSCTNTATSNIIVNPAPTVNLGVDTLVCGQATVVLNAGSGFTTVQWSTGSTASSISVDSSGVGFGTKTITVSVTNSAGCLGRDTLQITFDNCSGIETSHEPAFGVYFYPNPFNGNFHILCERTLDYNIYDISGRLIESRKDIQGNYETGDDLAAGTYFIEFSSKDQRRVYQLVKATGKN
ncbi:MAG: SBBP repeat-containing protein [Bacteroidia bacterium]|nr:SBBP repeat-containing protein [Bacteroidia bacterium]MBP9923333.1 SBBP repeat-containing protein [Bacteroidia bacterium]